MKIQKTYKIRAGNNYSNRFNLPLPHRPLWKPTEMVAKLTLNESMVYRNDNDGWMKLCGFSRGHHHDNSFRFVWRCVNGVLQIGAYCYVGGIRDWQLIEEWRVYKVPFGTAFYLQVNVLIGWVKFQMFCNGNIYQSATWPIYNLTPSLGYLLTPHFENPKAEQTGAPHNINIPLEITIR
jgi:hypothetical protein